MPSKPTPRGVSALAAILAAGLLTATNASAGDAVSCGLYAGSAVAQQQQNVANGCGFSGPRWHNNHGAHFAWCMSAPNAAANAEHMARVNQLQNCMGGGGSGAHRRCNIYALVAIGQNNANVSSNCGLAGPRWQNDYSAHYNWCRNVPKHAARGETDARTQQLRACAP